MKLLIFYQPRSEHARIVEEFVANLERDYPDNEVVLTDVDSVEGTTKAELYDIVQYPTILAIANDGSLLNSWVGDQLPLINDVGGWLRS